MPYTEKTVKDQKLGQSQNERLFYHNKGAISQPLSTIRDYNKDLQRTSYNELLMLFKDSTSNNPTRVFDETTPSKVEAQTIVPKRTRADSKSSIIKIVTKADIALVIPEALKDPLLGRKEEEVIKDVKKTIEELVEAIQCDPVQNYVQSLKFETQKMATNDWKEVTMICNTIVKLINLIFSVPS